MPLFIFVTGYFSKNIAQQRKTEVDRILYTYIVFELLNLIFKKLTSIGCGSFELFTPSCHNWYLLGIFFWRLCLPYFNFYKRKTAFITIIIIAFLIGFYEDFNTFLGLYRIVYFTPFFLLGSYCDNINLLVNKYIRFRAIFTVMLIGSLLIISILSLVSTDLNYAIAYAFTPFKGYSSLTTQKLFLRFALRIIGFLCSIIISFCFLFIVSQKHTRYTHFGKNTLNVYLLHMFFVFSIDWLFNQFNFNVFFMVITSISMSTILTISLSSNFINRLMIPLTDVNKIFPVLSLNKKSS
jgi:fucose 4-O-acetylase-like acetyltransferase